MPRTDRAASEAVLGRSQSSNASNSQTVFEMHVEGLEWTRHEMFQGLGHPARSPTLRGAQNRLIAWSHQNLIAFCPASLPSAYRGSSAEEFPIYVVYPDAPTHYTVLQAAAGAPPAHTSPIRLLAWDPRHRYRLISIDSTHIVFWGSPSCSVNEWECFMREPLAGALDLELVHDQQLFALPASSGDQLSMMAPPRSYEKKYVFERPVDTAATVPFGCPYFLVVDTQAHVQMWWQPVPKREWKKVSQLLHASLKQHRSIPAARIARCSSSAVMVAVAAGLNDDAPCTSIMVVRVTMAFKEASLSVAAIATLGVGTSLLCRALPSPTAAPQLQQFEMCHNNAGTSLIYTALTSSSGVIFERWVLESKPVQFDFVKQPTDTERSQQQWNLTTSKAAEGRRSGVVSIEVDDEFKHLLVLYSDGLVELRDELSLDVLSTPIASVGGASACALTWSPNKVCFASLGAAAHIVIGHIDVATIRELVPDRHRLSARIVDELELGMVRCRDTWDVVQWLYGIVQHYPQAVSLLDQVVLGISNNFAKLEVNYRRAYRHNVEAVKSMIFRAMPCDDANYLDSQSRMYVQYVRDTVRFAISTFATTEPRTESANEQGATPLPVESSVILALLPLAEWVLDFTVYFLKSALLFLRSDDDDAAHQAMPTTHAAICLYLDLEMMAYLKELLMCIIRLKAASKGLSNKQGDAQKSDVSYSVKEIKTLLTIVNDIIKAHMTAKKRKADTDALPGIVSKDPEFERVRMAVWQVLFSKGDTLPSCPVFIAAQPTPIFPSPEDVLPIRKDAIAPTLSSISEVKLEGPADSPAAAMSPAVNSPVPTTPDIPAPSSSAVARTSSQVSVGSGVAAAGGDQMCATSATVPFSRPFFNAALSLLDVDAVDLAKKLEEFESKQPAALIETLDLQSRLGPYSAKIQHHLAKAMPALDSRKPIEVSRTNKRRRTEAAVYDAVSRSR